MLKNQPHKVTNISPKREITTGHINHKKPQTAYQHRPPKPLRENPPIGKTITTLGKSSIRPNNHSWGKLWA